MPVSPLVRIRRSNRKGGPDLFGRQQILLRPDRVHNRVRNSNIDNLQFTAIICTRIGVVADFGQGESRCSLSLDARAAGLTRIRVQARRHIHGKHRCAVAIKIVDKIDNGFEKAPDIRCQPGAQDGIHQEVETGEVGFYF